MKIKIYQKNNSPKKQRVICRRCGREKAIITRHNIFLCRICFRLLAPTLGFTKVK